MALTLGLWLVRIVTTLALIVCVGAAMVPIVWLAAVAGLF